jgi:hypothetical protein
MCRFVVGQMAQKGVTISSSEAELVLISEAVKEIKFIYYLLREIMIEVNLTIMVTAFSVGEKCLVRRTSERI